MNILNMFRLALSAAVAISSPSAVAQTQGQANTDQAHAADISVAAWIACFDEEPDLTAEEPRQILKLASATWSTKCEVIRQVLANEDFVERIRVHAGWMTHAAIGLDPTGELSNDLRQNILGPVIRSPESSTEAVTIAFEVLRCLRPDHSTDRLLLSEWLKDDNHQIAELRDILESYAVQLRGTDAASLATLLVEHIVAKPEQNQRAASGVLDTLAGVLQPEDVKPLVKLLVAHVQEEDHRDALESLRSTLGSLATTMDRSDAALVASMSLEQMRTEQDALTLGDHAILLRRLAASLDETDTLTLFADELGQVPCRLASQRRAAADRLLKGLAVATVFGPIYLEEGERELFPGLKSIVAEAELQSLVDTLKAPLFADGVAGEAILQVIEEKAGASFDGDLWRFVEWATTDPQGISLNLDLAGPGPWSILDEPAKVELPSLERFSFQPQGTLEMEGSVLSFVVVGDIAYLPAGTSGLRLVDVSDPMHPRELGHAEAGPYALATCVAGNFAYVAAGPAGWPEAHLHVVDVSNVTAPKVVGSIDLPDYPSDVAVRNGRVFVADHTAGMRVIDVSNPRQPQEVGALNTPGYIVDVALAGDYAFLADREVGLRAVDISTPDDPKEVSLINTVGPCFDLCVSGSRAYLATGEGGLVVVDISDPRSLKELATIPTEFAVSVSAQDNLVVIGSASLGCRVFDLTDLTAPAAIDLKMSANGAASFCRDNTCFISDVSFDALPYGTGNQTILRIYRVNGPGDAEPTAEQPTQTLQNTQPAPRVTPVKETLAAANGLRLRTFPRAPVHARCPPSRPIVPEMYTLHGWMIDQETSIFCIDDGKRWRRQPWNLQRESSQLNNLQ